MCVKKVAESFVKSPWGDIAVVSWGDPANPPMLMLHGYMDTAATFTFLVERLPDTYFYVGVDMPGHGKSDPFPEGLIVTKLHIVEVMRLVVEHMNWKTFIFMAHSMSFLMGIFYNTIFPNSIENMIFLDPKPAIAWYHVINYHTHIWYKVFYNGYYENYAMLNGITKSQTSEKWVDAVARNRQLTKEQSEVVLSRSFVPAGEETYRLSWEQRAKYFAHVHLPTETLRAMVNHLPPTLVLNGAQYKKYIEVRGSRAYSENLLKDFERKSPHFHVVTVEGSHDCHITDPEGIVDNVERFLKNNDEYFKKSKL